MPNYVRNIVKMEGIASLPLFTAEEGRKCFDFGKLIPVPNGLDVTAGSIERVATEALLALLLKYAHAHCVDVQTGPAFPDEKDIEKNAKAYRKTRKEMEEIGLVYASNLVKYHAATWYDWCMENWGTKWNAMDTEIIDENTIRFDTAWTNPEPVVRKLAERYPNHEIEHWWADEDVGCNTGYRRLLGDDVSELQNEDSSQDAYETYMECWNDDALVRDENGCWHLSDEYWEG